MKNPNGVSCNVCDKSTDKFVWSERMNKFVECSVCKQSKRRKTSISDKQKAHFADETSAPVKPG